MILLNRIADTLTDVVIETEKSPAEFFIESAEVLATKT